MPETWYVTHGRIEEGVVPGKRLGRHVRHDSRNLAYPWRRSGRELVSQLWTRHTGIFDQNGYGSCTGEAETGSLGTDPLYDTLPAGHMLLDQAQALKLYSAAEIIDGGPGLPSEDNGSSGQSAAQAAKNAGLISGYLHCFSLADVLDALETSNLIVGANWYTSFDSPSGANALVTISPDATVRGGHEFLCRGKDIDRQLLFFDNSWGTSWGNAGSFTMGYATLERLLAEQGDATVSLPLSVPIPAPIPVPVPAPPVDPDWVFAQVLHPWILLHHIGGNRHIAREAQVWLKAKGL